MEQLSETMYSTKKGVAVMLHLLINLTLIVYTWKQLPPINSLISEFCAIPSVGRGKK